MIEISIHDALFSVVLVNDSHILPLFGIKYSKILTDFHIIMSMGTNTVLLASAEMSVEVRLRLIKWGGEPPNTVFYNNDISHHVRRRDTLVFSPNQ
jgi:hypothetical protein